MREKCKQTERGGGRERERERERVVTFNDDEYPNLVGFPLVLHVQHTRKLQRQQKSLIKVVCASYL